MKWENENKFIRALLQCTLHPNLQKAGSLQGSLHPPDTPPPHVQIPVLLQLFL